MKHRYNLGPRKKTAAVVLRDWFKEWFPMEHRYDFGTLAACLIGYTIALIRFLPVLLLDLLELFADFMLALFEFLFELMRVLALILFIWFCIKFI